MAEGKPASAKFDRTRPKPNPARNSSVRHMRPAELPKGLLRSVACNMGRTRQMLQCAKWARQDRAFAGATPISTSTNGATVRRTPRPPTGTHPIKDSSTRSQHNQRKLDDACAHIERSVLRGRQQEAARLQSAVHDAPRVGVRQSREDLPNNLARTGMRPREDTRHAALHFVFNMAHGNYKYAFRDDDRSASPSGPNLGDIWSKLVELGPSLPKSNQL